jgi:hypothetical protein
MEKIVIFPEQSKNELFTSPIKTENIKMCAKRDFKNFIFKHFQN